MKFKDRLITQTVICMMIFAVIKTVGMIDVKPINKIKNTVSIYYNENYTAEDIRNVGSKAVKEAKDIKEAVTVAVNKANLLTEVQPLGKSDKKGLQAVFASEGGTVTSAGIDKKNGCYITIKSTDSSNIYTYGNLSEISVITGDKVKKGDIIGSFDSKGKEEFYYQKN